MNSDLHIQCNKYLQNLTARHSAILETDTAAELAFFQEAATNFGKLIEYISIVKEMEDEMANRVAKLKQLGVDIGIPPIVQQPTRRQNLPQILSRNPSLSLSRP